MFKRRYLELSAKEEKLLNEIPLSKGAQDAFPRVRFDLSEASKCLALKRFTACVFHSMRSLEVPLKALADKLSVVSKNPNWENVLIDIAQEVRAISTQGKLRGQNWKEEEKFYSEAIADFRIFKNAWRNYVTHSSENYVEEQAREIMDRTRSFIEHLSERFAEPCT